jgi:hypothetical protein
MENSPTICLLHWNEAEAHERLGWLAEAGFSAYHLKDTGPLMLKQLREQSPAAFLIDLSRLPSHGREVAAALRSTKSTRTIPLVFVDGQPDKVERIRDFLPDAVYTSWEDIGPSLREAIAHPPAQPVKTQSSMDAYAGQPLLQKLSIKPGMLVGLLDAPPNFPNLFEALPEGAQLVEAGEDALDMLLWFVEDQDVLDRGITAVTHKNDLRFLWIAWPKKGSPLHAGLTQPAVRQAGLSNGWVDYKICSIDSDWSALLFARRR